MIYDFRCMTYGNDMIRYGTNRKKQIINHKSL